jgi:hypothetical protein
MIQSVGRFVGLEALYGGGFLSCLCLCQLLSPCLKLSEDGDERIVSQETDVLGVVIGFVTSLQLGLLLRISREDSLQNAQFTEISKCELQSLHGLGSSHVRRLCPSTCILLFVIISLSLSFRHLCLKKKKR